MTAPAAGMMLLPCPWCGKPPHSYVHAGIGRQATCNEEGCPGYDVCVPVDAWNRRAVNCHPMLLALVQRYASECGECGGTGLVTIKTFPGGIEVDNDDQPCDKCADIRLALERAKGEK